MEHKSIPHFLFLPDNYEKANQNSCGKSGT